MCQSDETFQSGQNIVLAKPISGIRVARYFACRPLRIAESRFTRASGARKSHMIFFPDLISERVGRPLGGSRDFAKLCSRRAAAT